MRRAPDGQTAAHLVDQVIPHVPVRQWLLSLPIPLRLLLTAQPKLVTPVLQVVHRVITRHLLTQMPYQEVEHPAISLPDREWHEDYLRNPVPADIIVHEVY